MQSLNISNKWPSANQRGVTVSPNELIYQPSNDPYALGMGGQLREDAAKAIEIEFTFDDGEVTKMIYRKGRITNVLIEPENTNYAKRLSTLDQPYSVYSPGLAGIARSETHVSDGILLRALARGDANSFLRNILFRLKNQPASWTSFERDLSHIFPGIQLDITFERTIDEYIDVNIVNEGNKIPLDLCGTGLLQCIHILSYYHLFRPRLIVLDEPDSHLHPNNQRLLCSLLNSLVESNDLKVIMTTHSRHIIDAMADHAQMLWINKGEATLVSNEERLDLLVDLGALDIKEKLNAGNNRCVVLTEDKNIRGLEVILRNCNFDMSDTIVLSYRGITSINLLDPLVKQIRSTTQSPIVVHRDRDYLDPDEVETWKVGIRALNAEPFVTERTDIEDYFVSDHVLENLTEEIPGFDLGAVKDQMIRQCQEQAIQDYVNGRIDIERKAGNAARLNHGQLAVQANRKFREDPCSMIKGKKKRKWLRDYCQNELGVRLDDRINERLIRDELLQRHGRRIFGNPVQ
jgi:hypothetical protein